MHSASGQLDADDSNRFVTQMEWALEEQPGVDGLMEYEESANIVPFEDPAYDLGRFVGDVVVEVIRTHPMQLARGRMRWKSRRAGDMWPFQS
jgi:hypothetical protein